MRISVINLTHGLLSDKEVIDAIRAINRQVAEDFYPYWNMTATLRLEGVSTRMPDYENSRDMQGEGIIYLWDKCDVSNALGYHEANYRGIPYGMVFVDISTEVQENWTVTFSHEVLELIGDRQANQLVRGPDPFDRRRKVYHWREMCDAVQDESYVIDGIEVSNFVLPLYFTEDAESGSRNDFLGTTYRDTKGKLRMLESFGINPGGYIGFYDPSTGKNDTCDGPEEIRKANKQMRTINGEEVSWAQYRQYRKNKAGMVRRGNRYSEVGITDKKNKIELNKDEIKKIEINGYKITICSPQHKVSFHHEIDSLKKSTHLGRGYFASDIYADAEDINQILKKSGLVEFAAVEVDAVSAQVEKTIVQFTIENKEEDSMLSIVDMDGVLFWYEPSKTGKTPQFDIPVPHQEKKVRGRSVSNPASKVIIRFIKHQFSDAFKKRVQSNISKYLAEEIEDIIFRKKSPFVMQEFFIVDDPKNKRIGAIRNLSSPLEEGGRYLLFIHGIFSSINGAFDEILLSRDNDNLLLNFFNAGYKKIIGFDHWTVAKSTLDNAKDLVVQLPPGCKIDIVCHSRGAGVTRALLEHPDVSPQIMAKNIQVGKVIFVAGACQGSPLAKPEKIGALVNVFSALSSMTRTYFPLKLMVELLKLVKYGVTYFPGIASMSPDNEIFSELNASLNIPGCTYIYIRSNYEPEGKLKLMFDQIGLDKFVFENQMNDGVVPFIGAGTFDPHVDQSIDVIAGPEYGVGKVEDVFHTKFFSQREVRDELCKQLAAESSLHALP